MNFNNLFDKEDAHPFVIIVDTIMCKTYIVDSEIVNQPLKPFRMAEAPFEFYKTMEIGYSISDQFANGKLLLVPKSLLVTLYRANKMERRELIQFEEILQIAKKHILKAINEDITIMN